MLPLPLVLDSDVFLEDHIRVYELSPPRHPTVVAPDVVDVADAVAIDVVVDAGYG